MGKKLNELKQRRIYISYQFSNNKQLLAGLSVFAVSAAFFAVSLRYILIDRPKKFLKNYEMMQEINAKEHAEMEAELNKAAKNSGIS